MDRNIRRALYTALVAGGLVVVGASTAHAAGEGLLDPVTQGTTETSEEAADTRGDLDAPGDVAPPADAGDETADAVATDAAASTDVGAAADAGATTEVATAPDAEAAIDAEAATDADAAPDSDVADDDAAAVAYGIAGDPDDVGTDALEARAMDKPTETPAEDFDADTDVDTDVDRDVDAGLVGDIVGRNGILDSLVRVDVAGVVDGTLGENGLVSHLLGVPPTDIEVPVPEVPLPEEPGTEEPGTEEPGTEEPGTEEPGTEEPGVEEPGVDLPGTTPPGTGNHPGSGSETPRDDVTPTRLDPDVDGPSSGTGVSTSGRYGTTGRGLPASAPDAARDLLPDSTANAGSTGNAGSTDSDDSVDIGWGDGDGAKPAPVPSDYDGAILPGGLSESLQNTLTEPAEVAEPVVVPGTANIQPGHLITGQLSLISLLLGLGIAVLRIRRR